jgi:hypothetical protein
MEKRGIKSKHKTTVMKKFSAEYGRNFLNCGEF